MGPTDGIQRHERLVAALETNDRRGHPDRAARPTARSRFLDAGSALVKPGELASVVSA